MNRVAFRIVKTASGPAIQIDVDGQSLQEWARAVELRFASAEANPRLAGSYEGLGPGQVNRDREHYLGSPVASWFEDGDTVLLGCVCGEWGCWPLTTMVTVTDTEVIWQGFRNGHRPWDLGALGPFRFKRTQYESSLDEAFAHVQLP